MTVLDPGRVYRRQLAPFTSGVAPVRWRQVPVLIGGCKVEIEAEPVVG